MPKPLDLGGFKILNLDILVQEEIMNAGGEKLRMQKKKVHPLSPSPLRPPLRPSLLTFSTNGRGVETLNPQRLRGMWTG